MVHTLLKRLTPPAAESVSIRSAPLNFSLRVNDWPTLRAPGEIGAVVAQHLDTVEAVSSNLTFPIQ